MIDSPAEVLRRHGLSARKSWGQNFLHDMHVHRTIAAASGVGQGDRVVEIGAGLGTLTLHLLQTGAEVWAIERDRDLCAVLRSELSGQTRFRLFEADAVKFDYDQASLDTTAPPAIVGNLPYHLTGPLLFKLLEHHATTGVWVVMVQKEVADRMCAEPGNKIYGGMTIGLSRLRAINRIARVGPGSFVPPPRVESAVVALRPRPHPRGEVGDPSGFLELVRTAFMQRRKTLGNALRAMAPRDRVLAWCEQAGVDPKLRPERLGPEEFAALQRAREGDA